MNKIIFKILEIVLLFAWIYPAWIMYENYIKPLLETEEEWYSGGNSAPYEIHVFLELLPTRLLIVSLITAEVYLIYLIKNKKNLSAKE